MKRLFPLILTFALLLCGCGKQEPQQAETTLPSTAAPVETPAPTETTGADQGPEGILENKDTQTVYLLKRVIRSNESGGRIWLQEYEYDELGQLTEQLEYTPENTLAYRTVYSGYENGLYTRLDSYFYDADMAEHLDFSQTFAYDDQGRVVYTELIQDGEITETTTFTYDDYGNVLSQTVDFGGFTQEITYEYVYDPQGNLLTCREYQDGSLMGTTEQSYDEQGILSQVIYFDYSGALLSRQEITWEGSTESKITYDADGNISILDVTAYDESGNPTLAESQYYGESLTITEYTYEPFEIQK